MPLKILCAGYGKDEKFEIEKEVKSIFAPPLDRQSWSISLVKLGTQITVSVDGPDERIRNKSFLASRMSLPDQLRELLAANGFEASGAAPSAPASSHNTYSDARPPSGAWPSIVRGAVAPPPSPSRAPAAPARSTQGTPVSPPRSAPAPKAPPAAAPAVRSRSGSASGRHARDRHQCPSCNGSFVVTYEVQPNEPNQLVAVACPHCWKLDRVEVGESAAIERAYRADKA